MQIGHRKIGPNEKPLVIAEIGINHGGDLAVAKHMVELAARSGCECIKHQTHFVEDEMTEAAKQIFPPNADMSIWDVMASCALSKDDEIALKSYTEDLGLIYLSTPFSRAASDFLEEIGVPAPDQKTLESYIMTKAAFRGADDQFSRDAYTSFVDNLESNPRMPQGLFAVVLEEDYRIDQIGSALSGPGFLLPSEALAQTQRNETSLKLATAEISYAEFTPELTPNKQRLWTFLNEALYCH